MLRAKPGFILPAARLVRDVLSLENALLEGSHYHVVAKPVLGRDSYGVKVCRTTEKLDKHCRDLLGQQVSVIIEDYLAGQEATITVMPPRYEIGYSDH
jgi:phosphoribosylamine-glycine ligase